MNKEELQLLPFGHELLRKTPSPFNYEEHDAKEVAKVLLERTQELNGAGLSANQVGLDMAVFTINIPQAEGFNRILFNPLLVSVSDETSIEKEGCLSFPGLWLHVNRPTEATFRYTDTEGKEVFETFKSLAGRIALHEYDHMLGKNFTMRVSKFKLDRALKALDKKIKRFKRNINNIKGV